MSVPHRQLHVLNVRLGFATNSSSSHSVLLLPGHRLPSEPFDEGYGWDDFVLTAARDKEHYLASQVAHALGYDAWAADDEQRANIVDTVRALLGVKITDPPVYVDHQSTWALPCAWDDESRLDEGFLRDLCVFMDRDDVVVLGGHDNRDAGEGTHPLLHGDGYVFQDGAYLPALWAHNNLPRDTGNHGLVCRRDRDHWTLFRRGSGAKLRIQFDNEPASRQASAPELVDVKITDYCPFGCSFCYQDSTRAGAHATLAQVREVAQRLAAARVFEVALGGGEPTLHPDFVAVLEEFRSRGVIPNFTTRNLGWLRNPALVARVRALCGSFAYSVQNTSEVRSLGAALRAARWYDGDEASPRPVVHVVMGTVTRRSFQAILKEAARREFGVTLLGWKRVGRATAPPTHPYLAWWWEAAKACAPRRLGIDTALAAEAEAAGQLADIPAYSYHTADGEFSCYIDAVAGTMAASSWQPQRGQYPFDEHWLETFAQLR